MSPVNQRDYQHVHQSHTDTSNCAVLHPNEPLTESSCCCLVINVQGTISGAAGGWEVVIT